MTPDTLAIIGTGIALAVLLVALFAWLRFDISRLSERMSRMDSDMRDRIADLRERLARVEVRLEPHHVTDRRDLDAAPRA